MKKFVKELADSSILKRKANVERKQYLPESFQFIIAQNSTVSLA